MQLVSLLTTLLCGITLLLAVSSAHAQPNLEGYWESEGEGLVHIQQVSDEVWIESLQPCPNGAQRAFIMTGQLEGNILRGMMWRCTDQALVMNCGHPKIYTISFTAQVQENLFFRNQIQMLVLQIRCTYEMEIWNKDDCQRDHKEPRLNFLAGASPTALHTPPTPWPSPTPLINPCEWTDGWLAYENCWRDYLGVATVPTTSNH